MYFQSKTLIMRFIKTLKSTRFRVAICMKNEKINTKVCGFEFVFFQNNFGRFVEVCIDRIDVCRWLMNI